MWPTLLKLVLRHVNNMQIPPGEVVKVVLDKPLLGLDGGPPRSTGAKHLQQELDRCGFLRKLEILILHYPNTRPTTLHNTTTRFGFDSPVTLTLTLTQFEL